MTKKRLKNKFLLEQLEQRLLFSADFEPIVLENGISSDTILIGSSVEETALLPRASSSNDTDSAEHKRQEILFVDSGISDYRQLVNDLLARNDDGRSIEVVVLDINKDGIMQISETLGNYKDLDAVHIVSHGDDGAVRLGNDWLMKETLDDYAGSIEGWRDALTSDADILFYGCNLAAGQEGQSLMNSLAILSGADVAASDDLTGHANLGGDWDLEHTTGDIETNVAFSTCTQQNWSNVLNITIDNRSTSTAAISAPGETFSHTTSGADRLMLVGVSFGENKGDSVSSITYKGTALTLVGAQNNSSDSRVEIWALVDPDTGPNNVEVTFSGLDHKGAIIGVMTFNNVDQTTPLGTFASDSGGTPAHSITVPSVPTEMVFGVVALSHTSDHDFDPVSGQSEHWDIFQDKTNAAGGTQVTGQALSTTMTWTSSNNKWAMGAVSIKANVTSAAPVITGLTGDALDYFEDDPATIIEQGSNVTVTDADSTNFGGGLLHVAITSGADTSEDILSIRNQGTASGEIGVSGSNITYNSGSGPVTIGTFSGGSGGNDLIVALNSDADETATAVLNENITYYNSDKDNPSTSSRNVRFQLYDGQGGVSAAHDMTVNITLVNDEPSFVTLGNQSVYEDSGPHVVPGFATAQAGGGADESGQTFSYTVSNDNAGLFSVAPAIDSTGQLTYSLAPNTFGTATVTVSVTDSGGTGNGGDNTSPDQTFDIIVNPATLFSKPEFLVNSPSGDAQETSHDGRGSHRAVAMAKNGDYVVVWSSENQDGSGWGVYGQRYSPDGTGQGEFLINETTFAGDQLWATVAMDDDGNFVVAWTSVGQDLSDAGIYARQYDATGAPLPGGEFLVNTVSTTGAQTTPSVAMDADGDFVIVWEGSGIGDPVGIFGQRFDSNGNTQGGEFKINTVLGETEADASVSMNANGDFVVVWDDAPGFHGRLFDSNGNPLGGQFLIEAGATDGDGSVSMDTNGNFVAVWRASGEDGSGRAVLARLFDANGNPQPGAPHFGNKFVVNTTPANDQTDPSVEMDEAGNFIVVWEGNGPGDASGVFGQKFDAAGGTIGSEFRINQTITNTQSMASLAMLDTDNFVVVWSGDGTGDANGVFARQYGTGGGNNAPTVAATANDTGTEDKDQVYTHGQMLTLIGASDADDIYADLTISISNVTNGTLSLSGGTGGLGTTFTFTPTLNFVGNMTFDYQVSDDNSALSAVGTATVTLSADNDDPTGAGALTTTSLNDNAGATNLFGGLTVSDVDTGENDLSLRITLSDPAAGTITGGGFTETAPGSGIYTLSGLTVATASTALDNVQFTPANNTGPSGTFTTDISVTVNDQGGGGERTVLNATTVTITRVNDNPTGAGALTTTSLNDNAGATNLFGGLTVSDVDSGENDLSLRITLSDPAAGTISGGGFTETAPGSGIYTVTGLIVATANTALDNVQFTPTNNTGPSGTFTTDISVTVNDQGGGGERSVLNATTVTITRVNDNPTGAGALTTTSLNDNAGATNLFGGLTVSDVDSGENDLSLRITLSDPAAGTITGGGFTETAPGSGIYTVTGLTVATANTALDNVQFTPANNTGPSGTFTTDISVTINDQGGGGERSVLNATTVTITRVNDNPTGAGALTTTSLNDNAGATNLFGSLTVSDVDSGENDLSLRITLSDPAAGTISGGGFTETAPGSGIYTVTGLIVATANTALDNVQFTPTNNTGPSGTFTTDISVTINDQGGGGERSVLNATTVTITRVNDNPTGAGALTTTSLNDNAGATNLFGSLTVSDVDSGENDLSLRITLSDPAAGTISGGGFTETAPGSGIYTVTGLIVATANTALDNVQFTPTNNTGPSGTFTTDISVTVNDQGGGGERTVLNATTMTITRVNDNPTGAGTLTTTSLNDNAGATNLFGGLTVSDVDPGENDLSLRITLSDPAAGSISGGGFTETAPGSGIYTVTGLTVATANTALDNVQFTPTNNSGSSGTFTTDISVTVNDQGGGGERSVLNATTVTITRVNDNPTGAGALTTTSLNDNAGATNLFGGLTVSDVDPGENDLSLRITLSNPAAGTMTGGGFTETAPGSGIYTVTGLTVATANTALDNVQFTPTNNSGSSGTFTTDISVTVNDQGGGGERSVLNATTVTITRVNDNPTGAGALTTTSLNDNAGATNLFGGLTVSDVDPGENDLSLRITLSNPAAGTMTGGGFTETAPGSGIYTVTGLTVATANTALDNVQFTPTSNSGSSGTFTTDISVTVNDQGGGGERTVLNATTVTITRINDVPAIGGVDTGSVTEDVDPDTDGLLETSGTLTITDADSGEDQFAAGTIAGTYGSLIIDNTGNWSYSADNTQAAIQLLSPGDSLIDTISVATEDGTSHDIVITINGANEAPTAIKLDNSTVDENDAGAAIGILTTVDADSGDSHSYVVDDTRFEIVGKKLKLKTGQSLDRETEPTVDVIVTSTDSGGLSISQTFTITVNNVNEAPTGTNLNAPETFSTDTLLNLTDIVVSDVDSAKVTVRLILSDPAAGTLSTATSGSVTSTYNPSKGVWKAKGLITDVNALLAGVVFTPKDGFSSDFTLTTIVKDGKVHKITGMKNMTYIPVADPPADPDPVDELPELEPEAPEEPEEPAEDILPEAPGSSETERAKDRVRERTTKKPPVTDNAEGIIGRLADKTRSNIRSIMNDISSNYRTLPFELTSTDPGLELFAQEISSDELLIKTYNRMRDSLDLLKNETANEIQFDKMVVGSTIAASTGLSVGYVIWLIRSGMLLTSVLASLPAWQIADPLPILSSMRGDDDDDDESLEDMLKKREEQENRKERDADE